MISFNPRKGICSECGKKDEHTHLHHTQYDETDPLAHTVELCASCHNKKHIRHGKPRKQIPPELRNAAYVCKRCEPMIGFDTVNEFASHNYYFHTKNQQVAQIVSG